MIFYVLTLRGHVRSPGQDTQRTRTLGPLPWHYLFHVPFSFPEKRERGRNPPEMNCTSWRGSYMLLEGLNLHPWTSSKFATYLAPFHDLLVESDPDDPGQTSGASSSHESVRRRKDD